MCRLFLVIKCYHSIYSPNPWALEIFPLPHIIFTQNISCLKSIVVILYSLIWLLMLNHPHIPKLNPLNHGIWYSYCECILELALQYLYRERSLYVHQGNRCVVILVSFVFVEFTIWIIRASYSKFGTVSSISIWCCICIHFWVKVLYIPGWPLVYYVA